VLTTTLDQVLQRPVPRVVVDLSGVEFCDSTGLSAFVVGHNRAAAAAAGCGSPRPSAWMSQLLDTVGLSRRLGIYPGVAEALAAVDLHRSWSCGWPYADFVCFRANHNSKTGGGQRAAGCRR
jgi:anti-anti-sigma regulatory factor